MNGFDPLDKESWYFGALKRQEAQDILESEKESCGSFLVRDSSTCPGDFVLCVKEENMIRHYIMKKMEIGEDGRYCFKIGNEIFTDVASLLKYYTYNYLDSTFLSKPATKLKFIGLYDFPGKDSEDLPFKKDEILTAIKKNEENWWTAKNQTGQTGSIPSTYIVIYKDGTVKPGTKSPPLSILSPNHHHSTCQTNNSLPPNSTTLTSTCANGKKFFRHNTPKSPGNHDQNVSVNGISPKLQNHAPNPINHFALPRKSLPAYALVRQARNPNAYDKTALKLKVGEVIKVTKMNINGQWEGELNGKTGFFPFTHIQFIEDDKLHHFLSLKQQSRDKQVAVPANSS